MREKVGGRAGKIYIYRERERERERETGTGERRGEFELGARERYI